MARRPVGDPPPAPPATRRSPRTDREGVQEIEGLPPSFTFKQRGHADADLREAQAIITALNTRPGTDAMVKRFQKAEKAVAFADYLRAVPPPTENSMLDVHVSGCEVYAKVMPVIEPEVAPAAREETI